MSYKKGTLKGTEKERVRNRKGTLKGTNKN